MAKVEVNPGICGLRTEINAVSDDMQNVELVIKTQCPHIKSMANELGTIDSYNECFKKVEFKISL